MCFFQQFGQSAVGADQMTCLEKETLWNLSQLPFTTGMLWLGVQVKLTDFYAQERFLDAQRYLGHMLSDDFTVAEVGILC